MREVVLEMLLPVLFLGAEIVSELLAIETGSPDALCPSLSLTTQNVHARLGTLKSEHTGWRARYTVGHAPGSDAGDFIRLELFDPNQELRLARDLPIRGESCGTLAQSIAIVLEAYFTSLAPMAGFDERQEPAPPGVGRGPHREEQRDQSMSNSQPVGPKPAAAALALGSAGSPRRAKTSAQAHGTRHVVGAGALVPFSATSRGAALLYSASPSLHREYGVLVSLPLERKSAAVYGGSVEMSSVRARLWYAAKVRSERFSWSAGPSLVLGLDLAEGRELDEQRKQERFTMALGLLSDASLWFHPSFGAGLQGGIELAGHFMSRRFTVEGPESGVEEEVHALPWFNGFVALALKARVFD